MSEQKETEQKTVTYDSATISNAEIVAPSIDKTAPDLEVRALTEGMKTSETKDAIMTVTGGATEINKDDAPLILRAAAAILTTKRQVKAGGKTSVTHDEYAINKITADDINRINDEFYNH